MRACPVVVYDIENNYYELILNFIINTEKRLMGSKIQGIQAL